KGDQCAVLAQQRELCFGRPYDLDDQVRAPVHRRRRRDDRRRGLDVRVIAEAAALAGAALDKHLVAHADELPRANRGHADARLAIPHLAGDADMHTAPLAIMATGGRAMAPNRSSPMELL